jgi:hypothetical protein
MILIEDLKKYTGFNSFLECFLWLKKIGKSDQETIVFQSEVVPKIFGKEVPGLKPSPIKVSIKEVKLLALEELFHIPSLLA